ncbi:MAG: hypothetical protein ACNS64_14345 [Candidatus Halalkalibacterium sp. M3_1C_030]
MIELHRYDNDEYSDRIQNTLDDMVLSYKTVVYHKSENKSQSDLPDTSLPFLDENGTKYSDKKEIQSFIRELSKELEEQRSISGDACYIDPRSGDIC